MNSKAFLLRGAQTPPQPCPGGLSVSLLPKIRSHSLSCRGWCVTPPFCCPFSSNWGFFSGGGGFSVWDFQMFRCPDVAFEAAALPCPPPLPPWERDLGPTSLVQNFLHNSIPAPARFLGHSQRSGRLCPGVVWDLPFKPQTRWELKALNSTCQLGRSLFLGYCLFPTPLVLPQDPGRRLGHGRARL